MIFERRDFLRAGEGGYAEYRIPGMVCAGGELLICCEARSRSGDDWGRIDLLILGEEGIRHVFAPPGTRAGDGRTTEAPCAGDTLNNPTLIADGDALHLIYCVNYKRAFHTVSRDGGRSWEEQREITDAFRQFDRKWNVCAAGPGHGIVLPGGRLLIPVWMAMGEKEEGDGYRVRHYPSFSGAIFSDDGGKTWQSGALFSDWSERADANETTCAYLPDGGVLFSIRHRGAHRVRSLAISRDGGRTVFRQWMEEWLPDPMCFGSLLSDGEDVFFSHCDAQSGRTNLMLHRYREGAWEPVSLIDAVGGYSDIARLNGRICVLYEHTVDGKIPEMVLAKECAE